jgi:hypothetical protein
MRIRGLIVGGVIAGVLGGSTVSATPVYRDTFHFCQSAPGIALEAAPSSGWKALASGKTEGKPSKLKINALTVPQTLNPIESDPTGPQDGYVYWSKAADGIVIMTDEHTFDISSVKEISYDQRLDLPTPPTPAPGEAPAPAPTVGTRFALVIGSQWYISDQSFQQVSVQGYDPIAFNPADLTYGTEPYDALVGPKAPANAGFKLPATGEVRAFGVFVVNPNGMVRLDNFTVHDKNTAPEASTPPPSSCTAVATPTPTVAPSPVGTETPAPGVTPTPVPTHDHGTPVPNATPTPIPTVTATPTPTVTGVFCDLSTQKGAGGLALQRKDTAAVLKAIRGRTPVALRDKAIVSLLYAGKRFTPRTLVNLKVSDFVMIGGKAHLVPASANPIPLGVSRSVAKHINAYLNALGVDPLSEQGPLFSRFQGRDGYAREALCIADIRKIVLRRMKAAGVSLAKPQRARR